MYVFVGLISREAPPFSCAWNSSFWHLLSNPETRTVQAWLVADSVVYGLGLSSKWLRLVHPLFENKRIKNKIRKCMEN